MGLVHNVVDEGAWEAVRAAQNGSGRAFEKLYNHYHGKVFQFALRCTACPVLADDISSETFLRALRGLSSVRYIGRDVGAWLITIARNVIIDHRRSAVVRSEIVSDELPMEMLVTDSVERVVLDRARAREIDHAVARLTPAQRTCIRLRFYRTFSVTATAEQMGMNPPAVRALQYRALRRLAVLLSVSGPGVPQLCPVLAG